MADNTTLPGTGTGTADIIVATDKIGGVDYQRMKLAVGDDGAAADVKSGGGTEAGSLRVTVANDSTGVLSVDDNGSTLTVDGTVTALPIGGGTIANGQVTPTASAATLLASRATRVEMTFYNGTNMTVYIGIATVSAANGFALLPGAGITLNSTALIQNIVSTVTGLTGVVSYIESY